MVFFKFNLARGICAAWPGDGIVVDKVTLVPPVSEDDTARYIHREFGALTWNK